MKMSEEQIKNLIGFVASTTDSEVSCQTCQDQMAEFVETQIKGKSVIDALSRVEAHLEACPECAEELGFIKKALEGEL